MSFFFNPEFEIKSLKVILSFVLIPNKFSTYFGPVFNFLVAAVIKIPYSWQLNFLEFFFWLKIWQKF